MEVSVGHQKISRWRHQYALDPILFWERGRERAGKIFVTKTPGFLVFGQWGLCKRKEIVYLLLINERDLQFSDLFPFVFALGILSAQYSVREEWIYTIIACSVLIKRKTKTGNSPPKLAYSDSFL